MALPSSGQITLNQILQEKQGNTTARTNVSLKGLSVDGTNDSSGGDITGTPNGTAPYGMAEFHDYSQITDTFPATGEPTWFRTGSAPLFFDAPSGTGSGQWGQRSVSNAFTASCSCSVSFKKVAKVNTTPGYISMRWVTSDSSVGGSFSFAEIDFTGHENTQFQAKCKYGNSSSELSESGGGVAGVTIQNPASFSPAKDTYTNISTSNYSPTWQWSVAKNSGSGTVSLSSFNTGFDNPDWTVRAGTSGTNEISGPAKPVSLSATRGTGSPPGGGEFCIHVDHLVQTSVGLMHIDDVVEKTPLIWSYDKDNNEKVLSRLRRVEIVEHDNLYKINNMMVTEDHILYTENYTPVSVNPVKAKESSDKDSTEIQVGDKLMRFDGTLEEVTSIASYEGTHRTYTLCTERDYNFYAGDILVDSEIS